MIQDLISLLNSEQWNIKILQKPWQLTGGVIRKYMQIQQQMTLHKVKGFTANDLYWCTVPYSEKKMSNIYIDDK